MHRICQELHKYKDELDPKLLHLLIYEIFNYVKGKTAPSMYMCQVMEQMGQKKNNNNINSYLIYERNNVCLSVCVSHFLELNNVFL